MKISLSLSLSLLLLLSFCIPVRDDQVILRKKNPMPNPSLSSNGFPFNSSSIETVHPTRTVFRDASIHAGRTPLSQKAAGHRSVEAVSFINRSVIPPKDFLNTNLSDWDLEKYEIVKITGKSKGCRNSVNVPIIFRSDGRSSPVLLNFSFAPKTFYEELNELNEMNSVEALFDSRLDEERQSYVFGLYAKRCFTFHSFGLRKKK